MAISLTLRSRFSWNHFVCWINVGAYKLVQCFQNWSVIPWIRVILDLNDGLETYPPGFLEADRPSSNELGVKILISESSPGITPNVFSLSMSDACEKTVSNSEADKQWPLTLRSIALLADLIRAYAAPWYQGLDQTSTHNQHQHLLAWQHHDQQPARPSLTPRWLPPTVSQDQNRWPMATLWLTQIVIKQVRKTQYHTQTPLLSVPLYNRGRWIWYPKPSQWYVSAPPHRLDMGRRDPA